ncbi:MAG TPA: EamA family transporter [Candidatus Saccharimonadales bacterium]|nr:EamA family transporter [Candidatus Saccharimonadales bacterium]
MWFSLSLLALLMLTVRRSTEKKVAGNISNIALTWLPQAIALPVIIGTLLLSRFYWPSELSVQFWGLMAVYVILGALDLYCYFKAISVADISYVTPLLTLFVVGNLIGAYLILGQVPSTTGIAGALLIMAGAYVITLAKQKEKQNVQRNTLALLLVLVVVVVRSFDANIEVLMLRESNPISFNFYVTILTVPFVLAITALIIRQRPVQYERYWAKLATDTRTYMWPLVIIGITYTINMLATYQAKLVSPNAAYVAAIKSAALLPIILIGIFFFKEKVGRLQWFGIFLIGLGLAALATNA